MTAADHAATPPNEGAPNDIEAAAETADASPEVAEPSSASAEASSVSAEADATSAAGTDSAEAGDKPVTSAPAKKAAAQDEPEKAPPPPPDPATCQGIVIGQLAFEKSVLEGEFDDSDFLFYLEPAGVLNAHLICTRSYPAETVRGGILMTKAAREAKKVFIDDGVNPDEYELGFPKEFGYVKSIQHYVPESREHAKFPWSKKY